MTETNDSNTTEINVELELEKANIALSAAAKEAGEVISNAATEAGTRITDAANVLVNGKSDPHFSEKIVDGANELGKQIVEGADALATQASNTYMELVKEGEAKK